MKTSLIRGAVIFLAGAGCASVVAGVGSTHISQKELTEKIRQLVKLQAEVGEHVVAIERGAILVTLDPAGCFPPPEPDVQPAGYDPQDVEMGGEAGKMANYSMLRGHDIPAYVVNVCRPSPPPR